MTVIGRVGGSALAIDGELELAVSELREPASADWQRFV